MDIVVDDFGISLGKKSERLLIKKKGEVLSEIPFFDVSQIIISSSGVSISTDVIQECMANGIQISFLSFNGQPYARISSPNLTGTVITRREQLMAYNDKRSVLLSKEIINGKIRNQGNVLKYFARYCKNADPKLYRQMYEGVGQLDARLSELAVIDGDKIDDVRLQIMSVEGRASDIYWQNVRLLLQDKVDFAKREHRGATDPVNSLLNYGYGMLYSQIWGALILAGLEPFAGFMHVDRPGKPSMTLDLIEEFRQTVVDRVVIAMIRKGAEVELVEGRLTDQIRKTLISKINERLDSKEKYDGKDFAIRTIIQKQARRIATYLRGENKYKAFVGKW